MAERDIRHPWGTCDRCGDDLAAQTEPWEGRGYRTPCNRCQGELREEEDDRKHRQAQELKKAGV